MLFSETSSSVCPERQETAVSLGQRSKNDDPKSGRRTSDMRREKAVLTRFENDAGRRRSRSVQGAAELKSKRGLKRQFIDVGVGYAVTESRIQLGTQIVNEKKLEEGG
jgi:hypothetical protein